jgi:branched-chain amino acid transport system substrate-binding protein
MKLTRRDFTAGLAAGITAPYVIGSAARAQGATLKIGMCVPVTGPAAEQGLWAQNGAKLALAAVNKAGGVLGKQHQSRPDPYGQSVAVPLPPQ